MALNKEQILTLTCLKDVGVKGVGPKKIFSIARNIEDRNMVIGSYDELAAVMSGMKEKVVNSVTLSDLSEAFQCAKRIIEASEAAGIGYICYWDEEFPESLDRSFFFHLTAVLGKAQSVLLTLAASVGGHYYNGVRKAYGSAVSVICLALVKYL